MGAPTPPDQTPDIRLSLTSAADLEAATTPNGHQKIAIEPTADADLGFKMLVHCDDDGAAYKALAKDEPARVTDFEATGTPTLSAVSAGVAVVDGSGIVSSVPGLTGLNFTLGTSIDESTATRNPTAHKTSHQNGGADEISVAGLSGQLADAQKSTRTLAYTGNGTVALAATDYITKLKENGGVWAVQDQAGTRTALGFSQTSGDGVEGSVDVDTLATRAADGWVHSIDGDGTSDDSPFRVATTMTDNDSTDPDHDVALWACECTHDEDGGGSPVVTGVYLFAEFEGSGV